TSSGSTARERRLLGYSCCCVTRRLGSRRDRLGGRRALPGQDARLAGRGRTRDASQFPGAVERSQTAPSLARSGTVAGRAGDRMTVIVAMADPALFGPHWTLMNVQHFRLTHTALATASDRCQ